MSEAMGEKRSTPAAPESPPGKEARRLVERVRRRLWLERAVGLARPALWLAAAAAAVGGSVHLAWRAHSGAASAIAAAGILVAATALALLGRRPSLESAAARADGWFGGRDLLASAVDLLRRPADEHAGAAAFVLERADERAAAWRGELRRRRGALGVAGLFAPLVALALAGFLHRLPGAPAEGRGPAPPDSSTRLAADAPPLQTGEAAADGSMNVWGEAAGRAAEAPGPGREGPGPRPSGPDSSPSGAEGGALHRAEARAPGEADPARAGSSPAGATSIPGHAAAGDTWGTQPMPRDPLETRFVDMEGRAVGNEAATRGEGGVELAERTPASPGDPAAGTPWPAAGGLTEVRARESLSPSLRGYVDAYQQAIRGLE